MLQLRRNFIKTTTATLLASMLPGKLFASKKETLNDDRFKRICNAVCDRFYQQAKESKLRQAFRIDNLRGAPPIYDKSGDTYIVDESGSFIIQITDAIDRVSIPIFEIAYNPLIRYEDAMLLSDHEIVDRFTRGAPMVRSEDKLYEKLKHHKGQGILAIRQDITVLPSRMGLDLELSAFETIGIGMFT